MVKIVGVFEGRGHLSLVCDESGQRGCRIPQCSFLGGTRSSVVLAIHLNPSNLSLPSLHKNQWPSEFGM